MTLRSDWQASIPEKPYENITSLDIREVFLGIRAKKRLFFPRNFPPNSVN